MNATVEVRQLKKPVLLFGATSIVGYNLAKTFGDDLAAVVTSKTRTVIPQWKRLSLAETPEIKEFVRQSGSEILIYCDAVCDVEKCEQNPDWATEINVNNLRRTLSALTSDVRFVYISSDHVFGGDGHYYEDCVPCPISHYGRTRVTAEKIVLDHPGSLIIRPGLPIGPSLDGRTGHMDWLKYRTGNELPVTIIEDEMRSAVHTTDLAVRLMELSRSRITGIRHIASTSAVARPDLAKFLAKQFKIPVTFTTRLRAQQPYPHLGRVELQTRYMDPLAIPLPSILNNDFKLESLQLPAH